ncbi:MAG TPA: type IV secretion system protein [Rhizomicrobium sp.]|nr:type IV secretion system protein [Rhizomicrobium sp.]
MNGCALTLSDLGVIRELLASTRCNVGLFSEAGFHALTGPHSIFPIAITMLLTIYVAVLGYRLLTGLGAPSLSEIPLIGLKIGTVLALTLNWTVFQTLVLDLSARAPTELAGILVGPQFSPLDRLQTAYDEMRADETAFAKLAQADIAGTSAGAAQASSELAYATNALLAATGGLLAFATVVTGVLAMVGPIFLALFLFESAGGLFVGWVRALCAAAFVPMLCWITTIILLATIEPRLDLLEQQKATAALDPSQAMVTCFIVYVFAAAQFGLVIAAAIVAVGFRFPVRRKAAASAPLPAVVAMPAHVGDTRIDQLVHSLQRSSSPHYASNTIVASQSDAAPVYSPRPSSRPERLGEDYRRMPERWSRRSSKVGRS